jgi:hypothetical protein
VRTRIANVGCSLLLLASFAGCSRSSALDTAGLQEQIRSLLEERGGLSVNAVTCPSDVKVEVGATFDCTATGQDGTSWVIHVTQRDDQGNVDIEIADAA